MGLILELVADRYHPVGRLPNCFKGCGTDTACPDVCGICEEKIGRHILVNAILPAYADPWRDPPPSHCTP